MLQGTTARYRHVDRVAGTAWLARRASLDRIGIDRALSMAEGQPVLACADGDIQMYSPDPYNYLRFLGVDVTPEVVAACLDARGAIAIGRDEVMI